MCVREREREIEFYLEETDSVFEFMVKVFSVGLKLFVKSLLLVFSFVQDNNREVTVRV